MTRERTEATLEERSAAERPAPAGSTRGVPMLVLLVREMRPRQWSKNGILFAALIFSKNLLDGPMLRRSLGGFLVFCLLSGVVYTINDLLDLKEDRLHEVKRLRPLASGALPAGLSVAWTVAVAAVALGAAGLMGSRFLLISVGFLAFNLAYSLYFKNVVLWDVISISISFIIRAIAGVIALNTLGRNLTISPWLLVVTFFLSLLLGLCKRRHEYVTMRDAGKHRATLDAYSEQLLDQLINL